MPNPSPLGFARPRTPLQRRIGVALLLLSALLATLWALDGDRSPPPPDPAPAPGAPAADGADRPTPIGASDHDALVLAFRTEP